MLLASATDVAIAVAIVNDTLVLTERPSRFGGTFVSIADEHGIIEVADDMAAAEKRIAPIRAKTEA